MVAPGVFQDPGAILVWSARFELTTQNRSTLRHQPGVISSSLAGSPGTRLGVYEVTAPIGEGVKHAVEELVLRGLRTLPISVTA
jgi:hypothetical protein